MILNYEGSTPSIATLDDSVSYLNCRVTNCRGKQHQSAPSVPLDQFSDDFLVTCWHLDALQQPHQWHWLFQPSLPQ